MKNRSCFFVLAALAVLGLFLAGCQSLGEVVQRDPVGAIQSAIKIGGAAIDASKDITEEQEKYLGRSVSARLLKQYKLVNTSSPLHKYVNMVGATVGQVSDRPDLNYHFGVLDTPEVNAFAAPGGYIFITMGMLKSVNDEEELAAILAHEIGHAAAKHGLKSIKGELWKKVAVITAQETARHQGLDPQLLDLFNQATDRVVDVLVTVGYDQQMEFEADQLGQTYAARAGYDPGALRRNEEKMLAREKAKDKTLMARLGTHPSFEARLNKLPSPEGTTPPASILDFRRNRFLAFVR